MEHYVNIFILAILGIIFISDAIFAYFGKVTISGQVTKFIKESKRNLIMFLAIVVLICIHWIFGV